MNVWKVEVEALQAAADSVALAEEASQAAVFRAVVSREGAATPHVTGAAVADAESVQFLTRAECSQLFVCRVKPRGSVPQMRF